MVMVMVIITLSSQLFDTVTLLPVVVDRFGASHGRMCPANVICCEGGKCPVAVALSVRASKGLVLVHVILIVRA